MTQRVCPIRIAGASGSASDRRHAFSTFASNYPNDPVDVIIGDWLSEANLTSLNAKKLAGDIGYEPTFLEALEPALDNISRYGIRVAVNAGGNDCKALVEEVKKMIRQHGLEGRLKVAWIEGDDCLPVVKERLAKSGGKKNADSDFENICTKETLADWPFKDSIIGGQAYLGGLGIAKAFQEGVDIVLAGRVSDASPVIGAAYWWHNWSRSDLIQLANAFVAGHLIECSNYVCGGNFTGFKELEKGWNDVGYPIAEIGRNGDVVITKQKGTGGAVTVDTCKAQLLYEIQGPWYYNSDVTAILDEIAFEQKGSDRVALSGVKAGPPPPTTKIGITANGGYQAEVHWFLVGLDIEDKAKMLEQQIRHALGDTSRYHVLKFTLNGSARENPTDQNSATVDFRVFAQSRDVNALAPNRFLRPIIDLVMCGYPGATFHLDFRQGIPKPVFEYFVTLLPQVDLQHTVHLDDGREITIPPPTRTKIYPSQQPSIDATTISNKDVGETVRGPLGWLVHARSGDKGSNANVGFWVRHQDEYDWLRTVLNTKEMKSLLANEYSGNKIDRFELPNIRAIHFLLHDHLDRGVSCSSTYDFLAKNVAEYVRSRHVDLPKRFLNRGKL
ncbi:hypothetical protein F5884DRAFT_373006 [Xylogone sp. PMI_703]|nr:hypothetical protein F5884DRAFT_373006 [Xylogone sp. PMI_703]